MGVLIFGIAFFTLSLFHGIATTFNTQNGMCTAFYNIQSTFCQTAAKRLGWQHDKIGVRGSQEIHLEERNLLFGDIRGVRPQAGTQTFE